MSISICNVQTLRLICPRSTKNIILGTISVCLSVLEVGKMCVRGQLVLAYLSPKRIKCVFGDK